MKVLNKYIIRRLCCNKCDSTVCVHMSYRSESERKISAEEKKIFAGKRKSEDKRTLKETPNRLLLLQETQLLYKKRKKRDKNQSAYQL